MKAFIHAFLLLAVCAVTGMGIEALGVTLYGWKTTGTGLLVGVLFGAILFFFCVTEEG